jgi:hypothetical protein
LEKGKLLEESICSLLRGLTGKTILAGDLLTAITEKEKVRT